MTPWTAAHQAPLSSTNSQSFLRFMSTESVMLSNHLFLCFPLLLLPSIFSSIRDFSNDSALQIRWPKYWSFSFSISLSNEYSGLIFFRMDWFDLHTVQGTLKSPLQKYLADEMGKRGAVVERFILSTIYHPYFHPTNSFMDFSGCFSI